MVLGNQLFLFSMKEDDVIVLIDVGICTTNTIDDVRRALLSLISSGMVGRFRVSENDFRIRQIGIDTQRRECSEFSNHITLVRNANVLHTDSIKSITTKR